MINFVYICQFRFRVTLTFLACVFLGTFVKYFDTWFCVGTNSHRLCTSLISTIRGIMVKIEKGLSIIYLGHKFQRFWTRCLLETVVLHTQPNICSVRITLYTLLELLIKNLIYLFITVSSLRNSLFSTILDSDKTFMIVITIFKLCLTLIGDTPWQIICFMLSYYNLTTYDRL